MAVAESSFAPAKDGGVQWSLMDVLFWLVIGVLLPLSVAVSCLLFYTPYGAQGRTGGAVTIKSQALLIERRRAEEAR